MLTKPMIVLIFMVLTMGGQCSESDTMSKQRNEAMEIDYNNKSDSFWKQNLKPEVYNICRQKGTELAGTGTYDHFFEKGTYYCACCGGDHALYSSDTKFDSRTGWPSFWAPISPTSVREKEDKAGLLGHFYSRTEVVCSRCGGHLGHVFNDGPKEHTGLRYCMNSVALTFVPERQEPKHNLENSATKEGAKS